MPYTLSSPNLPSNVKKLPVAQRRRWISTFNSVMKDDGDETKAFRIANGMLKKGKKGEEVKLQVVGEKGYVSGWDTEIRQFPKDQANYNPLGATSAKGCANCNWFVSPNSCVLVGGDISPTGISKFYEPVPAYEMEPLKVFIVGSEKAAPMRAHMDEDEDEHEDKAKPRKKLTYAKKNIFKSALDLLLGTKDAETQTPRAFALFEDTKGNLRFIANFTNNFQDAHTEILCDAAHKEYVEWVNSPEGIYPELHIWHCGSKSRFGQVDFVDYVDGFVVAAGIIDADKHDLAGRIEESNPGVSHGFVGLKSLDGVWYQYRTFEISTLPANFASNKTLNVLYAPGTKEFFMPFDPAKKQYLVNMGIPEEDISAWEQNIKAQSENLAKTGIQFKSSLEADNTPVAANASTPATNSSEGAGAPEPNAGPGAPSPEFATKSELAFLTKLVSDNNAAISAVAASLATISEGQKAIVGQLTEVKKPIDQQVEQAYLAAVAKNPGGFVASESPATVTKEQEHKADFDWFDQIVAEQTANVGVR